MRDTTGTGGSSGDDGARPTSGRDRLDRAPGERYRGTTPPAGPGSAARPGNAAPPTRGAAAAGQGRSTARGIGTAAGLAVVVAIVRMLLGQLDLGIGSLAIAAFAGWVIALALVWGSGGRPMRRRWLIAAVLAVAAIVGGLLLEWLVAGLGGGALGPLSYVNERYGPVAYVEVLVAGLAAGLRAR